MKTATRTLLYILFLSIAAAGGLVLAASRTVAAQSGSCSNLISETSSSIVNNQCRYVSPGFACHAVWKVVGVPTQRTKPLELGTVGGASSLNDIESITTGLPRGGAFLVAGKSSSPVKMYVFGDTKTVPLAGNKRTNFTLRNGNGKPICDRTRSGMLLQSAGAGGEITVNNLRIRLGSTAYVVAGGDLLFDQDPRIDRRQGQRNPNAPLCSGFDSDCSFGDAGCTTKQRLVWGPYCREDRYPYIQPGLYRVSLDGEGAVQAGATDYELSGQQHFSLGSQKFDLPGAYTFCWPGWKAGSTGFETIVEPAAPGARVDHITLEYLGRSCKLPTAEANADNAPMAMMTVYNVEGQVQVTPLTGRASGQTRTINPGQRIRVYYSGNDPSAIDAVATDASYVTGGEVTQWAAYGDSYQPGLAAIVEGSPPNSGDTSSGPIYDEPTIEPSIGSGKTVDTICSSPIEGGLADLWDPQLGCPVSGSAQVWSSWTPFERGQMMWRSDTNRAYGFFNSGRWQYANDQWDGVSPVPSRGTPPSGLQAPIRGTGYIWGTDDTFFNELGWARAEQKGFCALVQTYENGFLMRSSQVEFCKDNLYNHAREGDFPFMYLRAYNDGRWQSGVR